MSPASSSSQEKIGIGRILIVRSVPIARAVVRLSLESSPTRPTAWRCRGVVECQHCQLMFTDPRPPADAWHLYYPSDYHPYQIKPVVGWRKRIGRAIESGVARLGTKTLFRHISPMLLDPTILSPEGTGRMVDIGCGAADYMIRLRDAGWNVVGLEPSPHAAERARQTYGVTVLEGMFPSNKLAAESFDLVTVNRSSSTWKILFTP